MSAAELDEPLPEGVFHLLIADDDLARPYEDLVTVCGEVVSSSALPPSCYPPPEDKPDGEPDRDPLFCPACVQLPASALTATACRWRAGMWSGERAAIRSPAGGP